MDEFSVLQNALQASNDGFATYKTEMDELQKDVHRLREKNEALQETIKRGPVVDKQITVLTKLLRTLQAQKEA